MKYLLGALLLILLLLQVSLWSGTGSLQDIHRLEQSILAQEKLNAELQARNDALRQEVADLKTGQDAMEERARNELGLIRKGETYYLINDDPAPLLRVTPAGNETAQ